MQIIKANIMKKLFLLISLIAILVSCKKDPDVIYVEVPSDETEQGGYYLSFQVVCEGEYPVYCKVIVFDQTTENQPTKKILLTQNTNPNDGWIFGVKKFDYNDLLRIELWEGEEKCIMWDENVSIANNSNLFISSKEEFKTNTSARFGLGTCGDYYGYQNAWGP